jgi:hypothetical protein
MGAMTPQPKMSRRVSSVSSALVVAGIAAVASYSHMRHLAVEYGQTEAIADMLPISVDGMLVVATVALGDGRRYRWSAWLAFWIGVVRVDHRERPRCGAVGDRPVHLRVAGGRVPTRRRGHHPRRAGACR